jgi:hypothetical protein
VDPLRLVVTALRGAGADARSGEPVTFGLPFPRGGLTRTDALSLTDAAGRPLPLQLRPLDRWSDGSIRWLLVDSRVDWPGQDTTCWLRESPASSQPVAHGPLDVRQAGDTIRVDTGVCAFTFGAAHAFPFGQVTDAEGRPQLDARRSGLQIADADGVVCTVVPDAPVLEEQGPLRVAIRWRARIARGGAARWMEADARIECFAGLSASRVSLTLRNPKACVHPGNYWELGDPASAFLRSARLTIVRAPVTAKVACSIAPGEAAAILDAPFEIYQESSGGDHWRSAVHVDRSGRVPMTRCGFRLCSAGREETGLRASPVVTWDGVSLAVPHFWENCPRAVSVADGTLSFDVWPAAFPGTHEIQGGEQKTHVFAVSFGADPVSAVPLDWCRVPALVRAEPSWYCASGAVPHLVPDSAGESQGYRTLVRAAIEGADTFVAKRERIDEYGWRHFGDIYADHESALRTDGPPLVSHYNNQYDAIAGFAIQFLRSGEPAWWASMTELAAHVVDIDLYHADGDKAAYSGGPFWHTAHYVDAGRSTHRAYPRAPGVSGGGPSCEHNYTGGLLLHHFLTGEPRSRETVVELAEWVLRIDDGRRTVFRWLDRGDTGLASATREPTFHGPGRGAAHSIASLLDGHRVTGDARYLEYAERLIRRCVHPLDDLDARRLLDAEERWSYTVFLQVLGRYLLESAERGSFGRMYAWARESLLHYARWMAVHERPYLDVPGELEYPTETWAAQDIRKCDVLLFASLHARDDTERQSFRRRATFFFDAAVTSLAGMATRTLARPVVILLSNGVRMAWFVEHPEASLPPAETSPVELGGPAAFVPQRQRAVARAKWLAGLVAAAALAVGAWAVLGIVRP